MMTAMKKDGKILNFSPAKCSLRDRLYSNVKVFNTMNCAVKTIKMGNFMIPIKKAKSQKLLCSKIT